MNVNEISGFDAMTEEIRQVYAERDQYKTILDEIKKIFKMGSVWTYGEIPGFVRTSHDWLCEKREEAEEQAKQFAEDICNELGVRSDMRTRDSILGEISKLRREHENHKHTIKKQEDFTEEAADILGVHPGDLSLSDVLEALRKLKREEKLDEMNCEIIANLREERDQSQRAFSGEHSRRLAAERYISDTFQRAAKELGMTCIPDGIDRLCDEIADLRNYRNRISCPKDFWEAMCDVMEMDPTDATPSDVIAKTKEAKQRLISIVALNPDTATWTDIYDGIKAEQKDHCNLISESYKMRNELSNTKDILSGLSNTCTDLKNERNEALHKLKRCEKLNNMNSGIIADLKTERDNLQRYISDRLSKICSALGIEYSTDTTLEYILDTIDDLRSRSLEFNLRTKNFRKLCGLLGLEPNDTTWQDIFNEVYRLRAENIDLSTKVFGHQQAIQQFEVSLNTARNDIIKERVRRKEWVRKYEEEHKRANSCDKLYKKYKALYDAGAPAREKLSDDLQTYRSSYEAIKNVATKNRSLMNTVAQIVGTVGMHDDVTMAGVLNTKKKANHWDILVDSYGEGTMRSLLDNIGIDVSGDKGNGLFG